LIAISRILPDEVGRRLDDRAQQLLGRAVAVAPELERHLVLSGRVSGVKSHKRVARAVSFDTPYAVAQHEGSFKPGPLTAAKAPTQDGASGRKYLERPFQNMIPLVRFEVSRAPEDVARLVVRSLRDTE